jgi:hypothetical protein
MLIEIMCDFSNAGILPLRCPTLADGFYSHSPRAPSQLRGSFVIVN